MSASTEKSLLESSEAGRGDQQPMRVMRFLGGMEITVGEDVCRGCLLVSGIEGLPAVLNPVYNGRRVAVRQDAEWPVPGFFIVSVNEHVGTLDALDDETFHELTSVLRAVRRGMSEVLGIPRVQMYQEEKIDRPHYHVWMLPLWPSVMAANRINPRIYEGNVAEYLSLFEYTNQISEIARCNELMSIHLSKTIGR